MTLTSMERLALSNLALKPQRLMSTVEPVLHMEALGLIVPVDGHEWRLYEITPRGREALVATESP